MKLIQFSLFFNVPCFGFSIIISTLQIKNHGHEKKY